MQMLVTRTQIVEEARAWIGTPFCHGQALKGVGCDCIGLVAGIAETFKMPEAARWKIDTRFRGYGRMPNPERLLEACNEYLTEIPVSRATLGDIMQYTFAKEPMHFAIISSVDPQRVIHSYERAKGVVENGSRATFWRLLRAYRFNGIA